MYIRILYQESAESDVIDSGTEYEISQFAGIVPSIGDEFLEPGVEQGRDRFNHKNRELLKVVRRVFNSKDNQEYIALICESRQISDLDREIAP